LIYKVVTKEPLVVILPSDHRLASREVIDPEEIAGETLVSVSNTALALRAVIDDYLCAKFPPVGHQPPLSGDAPTIDLVVGYSKASTSPILKVFLSRIDDLIVSKSRGRH
jgi:LysR family hca operon transcriptional activator